MAPLNPIFRLSPHPLDIADEIDENFENISLYTNTWTGWAEDQTTWTRTGNHTFTVPTDLTSRYRPGTKIRYKDGGSFEYGYVNSSSYAAPTTTVNLVPNSDYVMAAATITDNGYSYDAAPQGFPEYFNYAITLTAVTTNPTIGNGTLYGRFSINGLTVHVEFGFLLGSTSTNGTGVWIFSLPVNADQTVQLSTGISIGTFHAQDANGGPNLYAGWVRLRSNSTIDCLYHDDAAAGRVSVLAGANMFSFGNTDFLRGTCVYEMD